jgi:ribulose-5-phosphate 4-epimerase/fuculose-1-phosphate aldolase
MNAMDNPTSDLGRQKEDAYAPFFSQLAIPKFDTAEAEREHRKQSLAVAFRAFAACGFCEGVSGHMTARDAVDPETFWVNPFGMHFGHIRSSDLIRVDAEGRVVEGRGKVNVSAFAIHYQIHKARPDVIGAAHTHSLYGKAWSAAGRTLDPITQEACAFFEDHVFFDDTRVLVTDASEAQRIAEQLGGSKAAILRNHGLLTVGRTVEEAAWWFISMERCCQAQFLAESICTPIQIDATNARATRAVNGAALTGWFQFQPIRDDVIRGDPEVLN